MLPGLSALVSERGVVIALHAKSSIEPVALLAVAVVRRSYCARLSS